MRRSGAVVVGSVLVAGVLAGCGHGAAAGSASTASGSANSSLGKVTTTADGTQVVTLQAEDDYKWTPSAFTVKPGKVRLTVQNVGHELTHEFQFTAGKGPAAIDAEIPLLPPGQKKTISFTVTTPGNYRYECSFHVDLGQVGTMTVGG